MLPPPGAKNRPMNQGPSADAAPECLGDLGKSWSPSAPRGLSCLWNAAGEPGQSVRSLLRWALPSRFLPICEKGVRMGLGAGVRRDSCRVRDTLRPECRGAVPRLSVRCGLSTTTTASPRFPRLCPAVQQHGAQPGEGWNSVLGVLRGTAQGLELSSQLRLTPKVWWLGGWGSCAGSALGLPLLFLSGLPQLGVWHCHWPSCSDW